jgi:endonuclease/exonuclease/phosphatase family metal-dependent hydrolase
MRVFVCVLLLAALDAGEPGTITIVTWNVLNEAETWAERLPRLHAALDAARPDIVCTQETTTAMRADLARGAWCSGLHGVDLDGSPATIAGLHVWSRWPIDARKVHLPTRMRRGGLITRVAAPGGACDLGVVHLDSRLEDGPVRSRQLAVMNAALPDSGDAILAGDFNFGDGEPDGDALRGWQDAWRVLHPDQPGFTWDLQRNPRAPANSFPDEPSRRIDRVLLRGGWQVVSADLIGGDVPTGSDHLGLRVVLRRGSATGAAPAQSSR